MQIVTSEMVDQRMVSLFCVLFTTYIYNYIHIYSLATILLAVPVPEADIVEVTVRRVRAGSKSISDRLFILWQEYRYQHRSGLSLVQAASQLLASF